MDYDRYIMHRQMRKHETLPSIFGGDSFLVHQELTRQLFWSDTVQNLYQPVADSSDPGGWGVLGTVRYCILLIRAKNPV